ncbi:type IV toxin-antitoxin system AbiEi family antitoxin domain-containing protein [Planotetraspora sp. A-T 1434]|uniref:type IV toxin-antitoxin system AbiEi family antitoxin domain-containing protein n=1 Tax=Planotetraspora sp. A-T 1434 TaxID=2979219 RepID=UPI0021C0436D|nr:type IV toxin-antitoxin system AbiEi family antitoxin domain-containing protein [Planotetraspora sp. A-T 1434]MCT9929064.1 type IV toxin-antitoxin system AbiEi family antitoxin domain-containing protein [Planotetraspora sp. A-T 1434]
MNPRPEPPELPHFELLLESQAGVLSRPQAHRSGITDAAITARLEARRWQRVHPGVYASFTGSLPREARLWAAILYAGKGAALSHETAAEVHGFADRPSGRINLTIPSTRKVEQPPGLRIRRANRFQAGAAYGGLPRLTTVEQTIADLSRDCCATLDDAYGWITRACARGKTTPQAVTAFLGRQSRVRWREDLLVGLGHVAEGAHSPLEIRFVRDVERRHGLPAGRRQRAVRQGRQDVFYEEFGLTIELDGRAYHAEWSDDIGRDNASISRGEATMRYGWTAVRNRPCRVAAEIADALLCRGWDGLALEACAVGCPIGRFDRLSRR